MLYCVIIDVFEGTDVNKTSESKECDISFYLYFLDEGFMFQSDFCNESMVYWWCLWTLEILLKCCIA